MKTSRNAFMKSRLSSPLFPLVALTFAPSMLLDCSKNAVITLRENDSESLIGQMKSPQSAFSPYKRSSSPRCNKTSLPCQGSSTVRPSTTSTHRVPVKVLMKYKDRRRCNLNNFLEWDPFGSPDDSSPLPESVIKASSFKPILSPVLKCKTPSPVLKRRTPLQLFKFQRPLKNASSPTTAETRISSQHGTPSPSQYLQDLTAFLGFDGKDTPNYGILHNLKRKMPDLFNSFEAQKLLVIALQNGRIRELASIGKNFECLKVRVCPELTLDRAIDSIRRHKLVVGKSVADACLLLRFLWNSATSEEQNQALECVTKLAVTESDVWPKLLLFINQLQELSNRKKLLLSRPLTPPRVGESHLCPLYQRRAKCKNTPLFAKLSI